MKEIKIFARTDSLVLEYRPRSGNRWMADALAEGGPARVRRTFYFEPSDLVSPQLDDLLSENADDTDPLVFHLGDLQGEYFVLPGSKLGIKQTVHFHKDFVPGVRHFIAPRNVSVFRAISRISDEDLFVGGSTHTAIPAIDFEALISRFPKHYELDRYVEARLGVVLSNYLDCPRDTVSVYENYMNKKESLVGAPLGALRHFDVQKYEIISNKLSKMLESETEYTEHQWQVEILEIVLLLNPRYLYAVREAPILDSVAGKDRSVDFMLVDYSGNIGVIEIKRPFDRAIVTRGVHRDNHIPMSALSGSVMQIEKYLYHLTRWGDDGEKKLTAFCCDRLGSSLKIRITNPTGILITGRDHNLSQEERLDFEVIRRHYKNVVDIVTYDDLLRRLKNTIHAFGAHPTGEIEQV